MAALAAEKTRSQTECEEQNGVIMDMTFSSDPLVAYIRVSFYAQFLNLDRMGIPFGNVLLPVVESNGIVNPEIVPIVEALRRPLEEEFLWTHPDAFTEQERLFIDFHREDLAKLYDDVGKMWVPSA